MTKRMEGDWKDNEYGGRISPKKRRIENGDSVQTHSGNMIFQQCNILPQDNNNNNNNNNSISPGHLIHNPNLNCNSTIDLKEGCTAVAPILVGNSIPGGVNINLHVPQVSHSTSVNKNEVLQNVKNEMKSRMMKDSKWILEGSASQSVSLDKIYTQLFIINDESDPINTEHEIWQIEMTHDFKSSALKVIHYNQILQPPTDENRTTKTILTKGIAGIGKTFTVQKFVFDWANGEANQDLEFVFLLPFRELNWLEEEKQSLFDLICVFYPEFIEVREIPECICNRKVLFILDGLDEYKKDLNFQNDLLSDVTKEASVDVLLVNLLRGKLLPSAHVWITSRPVAAAQLPSEITQKGYITQIRGFTDEQKLEYFEKQFENPEQRKEVIHHLKSQKSLWILCHMPLFCWISSDVLKDIIESQNKDRKMPSNRTEMYIHYLLIQTGLSHKKYQVEELSQEKALQKHEEVIMKLAELAYRQLKDQKVIFREEDLKEYNISVDEASQYPGVITCVSERKYGNYKTKRFSFVHLSVQEFFAAMFAFQEFLESGNQDSLDSITAKKRQKFNLSDFLKMLINEALKSKNGHLDLFNCFVFGISCDSSRQLLEGFLPSIRRSSSDEHRKVATYIKSLKRKGLSPERCISLIRCLVELKDESFFQDMHELERSQCKESLTPFQCTLLAFHFVMSDTKHDEFDLRKYNISLDGFRRFSPAITCFSKALFKGSSFTEQHCEILTRYLTSPNSHLIHLDLSHNGLGLSALKQLSTALCDPNCQIEILNLSHNNFQSQDMELIRDVLSGENMNLRDLDLSDNPLQDSGVEILLDGLKSPNCRLEVLKLSGCQIKGVDHLVLSLKVNSYLRELDLRYNDLGNIGEENLQHELLSLSISTGGECSQQPGLDKYFVALTFDPQTVNEHLYLSENNTKVTRQKEKQHVPANDERFDMCNQVLSRQPLIGRCFFTVDVIGPDVHVGVACGGMQRKGASYTVCLGHNKISWSLCLSDNLYVAHHNNKSVSIQSESVRKLGVFVDRDAGSVCFYMLSPQYKLLYMFDADFPEDQKLYAAFRIQEPNSSAVLTQESL